MILDDFKCRCGCEWNFKVKANAERLLAELEKATKHSGLRFFIISGHRCAEWNKKQGGKPASKHLTGEAADFKAEKPNEGPVSGEFLRGVFELLIKQKKIINGGLGTYQTKQRTLHYDIRATGPARWRE